MESSLQINITDNRTYTFSPSDAQFTKDAELFFANHLYNSCQATDELFKNIGDSQDDSLARKTLALYQQHYSTLKRPWEHTTFMYGLALIYMHFNAYNWAVKLLREAIYVQPNFDRSKDVHTRLGLIFNATGRHKLSEKHFNLAINDTRPKQGPSPNLHLTNGASKDSGISSNSSTNTDCALVPSQISDVSTASSFTTAEQVIEYYRNSKRPSRIDVNLLSDEDKPQSNFSKCPPYPPVPSDKLFPSPPSVFLDSKKDIMSKKVQDFCQSSPISIVRNIATVLKLDLGLFSTKTLVESNPDQQIEVVSHLHHIPEENIDDQTFNHWTNNHQRSNSTISRYACFQVTSFRESIEEELNSKGKPNRSRESDDSSKSTSAQAKRQAGIADVGQQIMTIGGTSMIEDSANKRFKRDPTKTKQARSANKVDLSDDKKWRPQLNELNKLPYFIKCVSASNMLSHLGTSVSDVNTVVMSMHVPGSRLLGNNTPNNFCRVNINVGPGDYEWCAISTEYERSFTRICNKFGFEFDDDNWWPRIKDIQRHNIPVYRFTQRPGDLVWVNSGTIYWVRSTGWCNSIRWNVGPLSAEQYRLASERTEINKLNFCKSGVPMVQLTWNIVININVIPDDELWHSIAGVLRRSLRYCMLVKDLVDESNKSIETIEGESGPKIAKYCSLCECEVFNFIFFRRSDHSLHCIECARRYDQTFNEYDIKQVYDITYLMKLYDNFIETRKKLSPDSIYSPN